MSFFHTFTSSFVRGAPPDTHAGGPLRRPEFRALPQIVHPTFRARHQVKPVPYVGIQFVAIPEYQSLGATVGQLFSGALAGQISVDDALKQAQAAATREMTNAGYIQ